MKSCVERAWFVIIQSAWDRKPVIIPPLFSLIYSRRAEEAIAAACSPLGGTDGNQLENLHLHDPAEQLIRAGYLFST